MVIASGGPWMVYWNSEIDLENLESEIMGEKGTVKINVKIIMALYKVVDAVSMLWYGTIDVIVAYVVITVVIGQYFIELLKHINLLSTNQLCWLEKGY